MSQRKRREYYSNSDRESIDEIAEIATSKQLVKFVSLLMEFYTPCEIVLVMRAAVGCGLVAKSEATP